MIHVKSGGKPEAVDADAPPSDVNIKFLTLLNVGCSRIFSALHNQVARKMGKKKRSDKV
jgi:hypothetical protein